MCSRWDDPAYIAAELDEPRPARDTLRESRTAHAVRTAGRPRRVLYVEGPDELPPEWRDPDDYRDGEPWP